MSVHRSIDTEPLFAAIRQMRAQMIPSLQVVDRLWAGLSKQYPRQVHIHDVGVTDSGVPIRIAIVGNNARELLQSGGHLSIPIVHASEPLGATSSYATGAFLRTVLHRDPTMVYRVLLNSDEDGTKRNSFIGRKLTYRQMLKGRHRSLGLNCNIDFEMPIPGVYTPARAEPAIVGNLLAQWMPETVTSRHQMTWSPVSYIMCNEPRLGSNTGYLQSLAQVVHTYGRPAPFDFDEPQISPLAPGVFGIHTNEANDDAGVAHGATMGEYLDSLFLGSPGACRWSLHDFPMFTTNELEDNVVDINLLFDLGTERVRQLVEPFLEPLAQLDLDPSDRVEMMVGQWIEFKTNTASRALEEFVPNYFRPDHRATPLEAFVLGDLRVHSELQRLSEAVHVAARKGRTSLAERIQATVDSNIDDLEQRRGIVMVPLATQVAAGVMTELVTVGGSLQTTRFDLGSQMHEQSRTRQLADKFNRYSPTMPRDHAFG